MGEPWNADRGPWPFFCEVCKAAPAIPKPSMSKKPTYHTPERIWIETEDGHKQRVMICERCLRGWENDEPHDEALDRIASSSCCLGGLETKSSSMKWEEFSKQLSVSMRRNGIPLYPEKTLWYGERKKRRRPKNIT